MNDFFKRKLDNSIPITNADKLSKEQLIQAQVNFAKAKLLVDKIMIKNNYF